MEPGVNCRVPHHQWPRVTIPETDSNIFDRSACRPLLCTQCPNDARYLDPASGAGFCGGCWVVMVSARLWGLGGGDGTRT